MPPSLPAQPSTQLPEVLPAAATQALAKVGIEVAAAGSTAEHAAALEEAATEEMAVAAASSGAVGAAAAAAISPDALDEIWAQEWEAWGLLFDGSALDEHMEVRVGSRAGQGREIALSLRDA